MKYLLLAVAIVSEVAATMAMTQSHGFTKPLWVLVTVVGYGVSFFFLSLTLKVIPTGIAYAIWSGVGIILIAFGAWALQGQKLDTPEMIGITLIVAGLVVMNAFTKSSLH